MVSGRSVITKVPTFNDDVWGTRKETIGVAGFSDDEYCGLTVSGASPRIER
jgi:hypothetical protein